MFGYIKPYKPEMKVSEFDTFKGIYCGLCKELSHVYGPFSSLTLSYDFTFIATISLGLSENCKGFQKCSCVANPLKRKMCHNSSEELTFCAGTAMLMIYYKVLDDLHDSNFLGKLKPLSVLPFVYFAKRRAAKQYPKMDEVIKTAIQKQAEIEKSDNISVDKAADPTANALAFICQELSNNETQKKILHRFGYLVGRYVYFADALDDIDKDSKNNEYNPFLKRGLHESKTIDEIKEYAVGVINMTIAEIAPAYELLDLKRYKPILDNIVYLGLHNTKDTIIKKKEQNDEQPV
ncbi:DUF5685 family protein [Paludicola sp. MB14-C6]|uniref:DUF5685 family protein n=1 Tax=Paludihabitans sp. MB14-C6 TaxID=3070656 RepID=UPI0027DD8464|nr:DUF5685 family protein [Paludicola sp. MB14-C6]WMJ23581.1 DUF5685 family protein [Paludicola sp. MB14-C6]